MKQILWSMVVVMMAALLLAGMVIYTVWVMRAAQIQILTGETVPFLQSVKKERTPGECCISLQHSLFLLFVGKMP